MHSPTFTTSRRVRDQALRSAAAALGATLLATALGGNAVAGGEVVAAAGEVAGAAGEGEVEPNFVGAWDGPWDYTNPVDPGGCHLEFKEFSHAALIPTGAHAGSVIFWRRSCTGVTTEVWLFDPAHPTGLVRIQEELPSDIFCSGMSWDRNGDLIVVGGQPAGGAARYTYRFEPTALRLMFPVDGGAPVIGGRPWKQIGSMSAERYYPTLIALNRVPIFSFCYPVVIGGGSHLVLSGPPTTAKSIGTELWQFLSSTTETWSRTLKPLGVDETTYPFLGPAEEYTLMESPGQTDPPEYLFDAYSRAFQLGEPDRTAPTIHGQVLVLNDIDTATSPQPPEPNDPPNTPGRSWVIKMPQVTSDKTVCFELYQGPSSNPLELDDGTNDRHYGTAVLLHKRGVKNKNRVLAFGGAEEGRTPGFSWKVHKSVQEFTTGPAPDPVVKGKWLEKSALQRARVYVNSVTLPTGQILLVGGDGIDTGQGHNAQDFASRPVLKPELYDPGATPQAPGNSRLMRSPNAVEPFGQPTPRLYHHLALLLADGRVLVGGGERCLNIGADGKYVYPDSQYSAEIFSPPYLFRGARPEFVVVPENWSMNGQVVIVGAKVFHDHVAQVVLTRPSAVTHFFDSDQRYVELDFVSEDYSPKKDGTNIRLRVTPPHESWCPPGYYLCWVVESTTDGNNPNDLIPSAARIVHIQ